MSKPKKEKEAPNHGDRFEAKVSITDLHGNTTRKSFYSLISVADAKKNGLAYQKKILLGQAKPSSKVPFGPFAEEWLELNKEHSVSVNTYESTYRYSIENHIVPYFKKYSIANIKKNDIQKFLNEKRHYSDSTLHKLYITLYAVFESAIENDIIYKNPCKNLVIPKSEAESKLVRPYTKEQAKAVIAFVKKLTLGISIIILLKAGLRREELLGLRWKDVDFKNRLLHIRQAVTETKGILNIGPPKTITSIRDIPMDDELIQALKAVPHDVVRYTGRGKNRIAHSVHNEYVIAGRDGGAMYPSHWQQRVYKPTMEQVEKECKVNEKVPVFAARAHELRHTYGTLLYKAGTDIYTISKLMGHSSVLITTKIYIENDTETIRKAIKMDW